MTPQKTNKKERKTGSKRSRLVVPLIIISMLICIIAAIILGSGIGRTQENTEIGKDVEANKEEILAETVQAGETYRVPETGIYKIELNGGKSSDINTKDAGVVSGLKGSKVTGYMKLYKDEVLNTTSYNGGIGASVFTSTLGGAKGISVTVRGSRFAVASGAPGLSLNGVSGCNVCGTIIGYSSKGQSTTNAVGDGEPAQNGSISGGTQSMTNCERCLQLGMGTNRLFIGAYLKGGGGGSFSRGCRGTLWCKFLEWN